jgi:hypothetical protein
VGYYQSYFLSTVKKALFLFFVMFAASIIPGLASAQAPGGQDSTGTGIPDLRPRRDSYIIVPYPSPARHGQTVKIQIYNHIDEEISLRIVDLNDKTVKELQPQQTLPNGIHSYDFETGAVATGTYFIRLTTYSSTGSQNVVQDARFIVLH